MMQLHFIDYAIFAVFILMVVAVGPGAARNNVALFSDGPV
jgi:hypothetical protein